MSKFACKLEETAFNLSAKFTKTGNKLGLSWAKLSLNWGFQFGVVDEVGS